MQPVMNFPVNTFPFSGSAPTFEIRAIRDTEEQVHDNNQAVKSNDYFEITWIVKGSGSLWIDLINLDIKDNQVLCIKPGQVHKPLYNNMEGYVITFKDSFLDVGDPEFNCCWQSSLSELFTHANGILLQEEMMADMYGILNKMMKEYDNSFAFKNEMLKRYLKIFLIYLIRQFDGSSQSGAQTRMEELVEDFMRLLDKNFRENKMVSEYAARLFVTPNYLNSVVKSQTGYSARHHIRTRVALEAKRIAMYSRISMKEIAYRLGFLDPAHFSKFFKTVTGVNFSDYKKQESTHPLAI